ncbi:unnamed protein product [Macrosiphum euphorbiae]|uniref:Uncharacterized protein n=1 Tax=Macrosiphum euphorbiae TaxID=13131 RepID=A0AAV0VYS1_9HEMI|nr:unnamed protein product [Macrosiphum euphorbiae]
MSRHLNRSARNTCAPLSIDRRPFVEDRSEARELRVYSSNKNNLYCCIISHHYRVSVLPETNFNDLNCTAAARAEKHLAAVLGEIRLGKNTIFRPRLAKTLRRFQVSFHVIKSELI